jgi:hypothetical protein
MTTTATSALHAPWSTDESKITKRYNKFSVFFMLERQLFLQSQGKVCNAATVRRDKGSNSEGADTASHSSEIAKYASLDLPPLCGRYANIPLSSKGKGWFVDLLEANREDEILHSGFAFADLSRLAARKFAMSNYRVVDNATRSFLNDVAERLAVFYGPEEPTEPARRVTNKEEDAKERREGGTCLPVVGHAAPPAAPSRLQNPPESFTLPPPPPMPFTYDVELRRLQEELQLAVSSYNDSNRRISIILDIFLERHHQYEQQQLSLQREQLQDRLANSGHLIRHECNNKEQHQCLDTREQQQQERLLNKHPLDPRDKEKTLPSVKRLRPCSKDYEKTKAAVDDPQAGGVEGHSWHGGPPLDALNMWADHRWKSLPPARRGINW